MLTLSLFDPAGVRPAAARIVAPKSGELWPTGWRGSGHRHGTQHDVSIGLDAASPGYVAGPIPPGTWQVVVDTHMIMPGTPCTIRGEVSATDEAGGAAPASPPPPGARSQSFASPDDDTTLTGRGELGLSEPTGPPIRSGRGWYRGDLHAHSLHSDAAWDIPDLLAWALGRGLDFATLSDHNTVSGLAQMDAATTGDLLTMGGMEFTTFWGHALALGIRRWVDWRVTADAGPASRAMTQLPGEVAALGGLFIIAHPMAVGDPYCTGCQWTYPTMRPGTATAVEVWNSDWRSESRNERGLELAYEWLNAGHRLALTAGTDNHGRNPESMHYGFNVIYAEERSEREILRAVRAGHLYISAGPTLALSATTDGGRAERPEIPARQQAMMGDVLDVLPGQTVYVTGAWSVCPEGAEVCLLTDGKPRETVPAGQEGTRAWELEGGETHWCLLTLRGSDGRMLALTNPIFFDGRM